MFYYEVYIADGRYRSDKPLTYSYESALRPLSVVTVPLQQRMVSGFILKKAQKPSFQVKPIKNLLSDKPLPEHCLELAKWLADYYACSLGEALRLFAPSQPSLRRAPEAITTKALEETLPELQLELKSPLTADQTRALKSINSSQATTFLLHGDTGTGKTRIYLELAKEVLDNGRSAILLTPEIALTAQLAAAVKDYLRYPAYVFHSQLTSASRKKIWRAILGSDEPLIIIGPRSALFSPLGNIGLIVVDEAHEPAYKQQQSPRYHASRVASRLGKMTGAKVVLGTATPSINDYYLATEHQAVIRMRQPALGSQYSEVKSEVVDLKDRSNFSRNPYLSNQLISAISTTLAAKKQIMIYLNRRGTSRLILCHVCGWQLLCPNCDIPLIYHGDAHLARCHICGYKVSPPVNCPNCQNPDIIYRTIGTKALAEVISKLFGEAKIARFDSDNLAGERIQETYSDLKIGKVDILVGTQLLAKGLDLPKLGLVGIVSAEGSLSLPDFSSEERAFQLLYQVMGRVGRGHLAGQIVIQAYDPDNLVILAALSRDWDKFYTAALKERQAFRFPPSSYLLKLTCKRATTAGGEQTALNLKKLLISQKLPVEVIGPTPSFYARRGRYYYWQLVVKSKQRQHLTKLAKLVPADWQVDLDPIDLL